MVQVGGIFSKESSVLTILDSRMPLGGGKFWHILEAILILFWYKFKKFYKIHYKAVRPFAVL